MKVMFRPRLFAVAATGLALFAMASTGAKADINIGTDGPNPLAFYAGDTGQPNLSPFTGTAVFKNSSTGFFDYFYDMDLSGVEHITAGTLTGTTPTGSFFTFYDVAGLVSGSEMFQLNPAGATSWALSEQATGITAHGNTPDGDSPAILNITENYTGVTPFDPASNTEIGVFSFSSTIGPDTTSSALNFGSQARHDTSNALDPSQTHALAPSELPEPAFFQMGGMFALGGLGFLRRKFRPSLKVSAPIV